MWLKIGILALKNYFNFWQNSVKFCQNLEIEVLTKQNLHSSNPTQKPKGHQVGEVKQKQSHELSRFKKKRRLNSCRLSMSIKRVIPSPKMVSHFETIFGFSITCFMLNLQESSPSNIAIDGLNLSMIMFAYPLCKCPHSQVSSTQMSSAQVSTRKCPEINSKV